MNIMQKNNIGTRLKALIESQTNEKGRFNELEEQCGISYQTWRSWWHREGVPNGQLIEAAAKLWPNYAYWLATGDSEPEYGNYAPKTATSPFVARGEPKKWRTEKRAYKLNMLKKLEEEADFGELQEQLFQDREDPKSSTAYLWLERFFVSIGEKFQPSLALIENDDKFIEIEKMSMKEAQEAIKDAEIKRENFWTFRSDSAIKQTIGKFLLKIALKQ